MRKKVLAVLLTAAMAVTLLAGCGSAKEETAPAPEAAGAEEAEAESGEAEEAAPEEAASDPFQMVVVVKGEDSEFWQILKKGAMAAEEELGSKVEISYQSVVQSTDYDGQIALLQNIITSNPDAIIAGPNCEGAAAALQPAADAGTVIVVMDTTYDFKDYTSFLVTDNKATGIAAADALVAALEEEGKPLTGSVGIISAKAGVPTLIARDEGFNERMAEIAPDITLLEARYAEGDVTKGISDTQDVYLANKDTLVGLYADANTTGTAIAMAIKEANLEGEFVVVATDSDAAELEALEAGHIHTLLVQDAYQIGYQAVMNAYNALMGETVEKDITPGVVPVTLENLNTPEVQILLGK